MASGTVAVVPGHSLGPFCLGASIYEVLTLVKEDRGAYSAIDLHYSQTEPLGTPVTVTLPSNGIRLRFDGAEQRLRLIEVLDFRKIKLVHKGSDLIKTHGEDSAPTAGPVFKRIYSLFGPSYPGEYLAPKGRGGQGTYVLSYQGVAFTFPLQHSAWSPEKDHVSLLGSHAASPAMHMAIFEGKSWPEARGNLFTADVTGPRSSALASRPKDGLPPELELASVGLDGRVELLRQTSSFMIVLNETTTQDLVTELGPPDATHKRAEREETPEVNSHRRAGSSSRPLSNGRAHPGSQPSSYSSTGTDTFETEFESGDAEEDALDRAHRQKFWCYFGHGLDILVGPSVANSAQSNGNTNGTLATSPHLVVLKVVIHGNIPGSYAFNRHRRLRWSIDLSNSSEMLVSEQNFDTDVKPSLLDQFASEGRETDMSRGKVVNRTWGGGSSSESSFFLPDANEDLEDAGGDGGSEQWLGNTKLYAFPGLVFEVLESGSVAALTIG